MQDNLPEGCSVDFQDPDQLHTFTLTVAPSEGLWRGGKFHFSVVVPDEYNNVDLLNFDDPLNLEAANHYQKDKESFKRKVRQYIDLNNKQ
ncbi:hypothetical protein HAZT_HAZT008426 [Hyalella azteca]|uniref:UBC core domain-containing protein n=1 Tax=Hyalella azteca TaxID=294128 RepID=A0A6A0H5Y1_HYAAZ|nr:hypothetical protein HAZT_HAZT008426 [Hyalella azteca]